MGPLAGLKMWPFILRPWKVPGKQATTLNALKGPPNVIFCNARSISWAPVHVHGRQAWHYSTIRAHLNIIIYFFAWWWSGRCMGTLLYEKNAFFNVKLPYWNFNLFTLVLTQKFWNLTVWRRNVKVVWEEKYALLTCGARHLSRLNSYMYN